MKPPHARDKAADSEATADSQPGVGTPVTTRSVALTVLAIVAAVWLLRTAREVLIPIVLALLISFALSPLVTALTRRKIPRALAVALIMILAVGTVGTTLASLRDETIAVLDGLPEAARSLRRDLRLTTPNGEESTLQKVQEAAKEIEKTAVAASSPATAPAGVTRVQVEEPAFRASQYLSWGAWGAMGLIGEAIMIVFLVYFLLLSGDQYKRKLVKIAGPTLAKKRVTVQILDEIDARIERFLMVQLLTGAIVALTTGVALWWVGLNQAPLWGLVAGVFNTIPYFGPVVVSLGLTVVGYLQFGTVTMALYVAAISLVVTNLEGWLLTPALMGKAAEMNAVSVFVSLIFWGWMWGVPGVILAVPIMMVVKAVCDHVEDLKWAGELLGE